MVLNTAILEYIRNEFAKFLLNTNLHWFAMRKQCYDVTVSHGMNPPYFT